ncbi:MAG: FixH family protein [Vicingaceae bacterium]
MNWGTKIGISYGVFVLFIIGMVYLSFGEKFDLVTEDYYAKELEFQDKIDAKGRLEKLDQNLKTSIENGKLQIHFPHQKNTNIVGSINCFRPSDQSKDFMVDLKNIKAVKEIPLDKFSKGKYLLKIEWTANEKDFYTERTVIIP